MTVYKLLTCLFSTYRICCPLSQSVSSIKASRNTFAW